MLVIKSRNDLIAAISLIHGQVGVVKAAALNVNDRVCAQVNPQNLERLQIARN